ncbi:retron St85 family RNA-directed DNA polymerase [Lysinibacillus sp. ZYM-1]|uniref:retron St85 family RNA-directed DNA polymerase n=1 Tax=Lysinibacillus sp. ZYM-1 TaxID=1681184 RepID=UPI0006CEA394|nr:retron St85 family RNA-directed DNA polymerase [Lysinibacillus sp. ZYM-1]KPN94550.1 hypothetical protein AO843_23090 [Lysinibacillus sp. ZYM-1]
MNLEVLESKMSEENISLEEIESTLSYARNLKENGVPVIFDIQHLRRLLNLNKTDFKRIYYARQHQYNTIEIPKNNGKGTRTLSIPSLDLKYVQRWILDNILYKIEVSEYANGFVKGKSVVTNANYHVKQEYVLKMDIKDFFPTITAGRVFGLFMSIGYSSNVAIVLTNLCTYNNSIPQGAPTSPYISNLICRNLDLRLSLLCNKRNIKFSRYADDITISGGRKVKKTIPFIRKIINEEGFIVNQEKTKLLYKSGRQQVTGIVVNDKLSIAKEILRKLRQDIYYIKKFGLNSHLEKKNMINKSHVREYYYGMANYILMVDQNKGQKLFNELNKINWK